ncbi:MAG: 2-hydroxyacid dehydrogenase [Verrucomicrobiales bacterium]|nr:2-hydroxyacid dehydrogenase [Verrucomicrobiales bacterium]
MSRPALLFLTPIPEFLRTPLEAEFECWEGEQRLNAEEVDRVRAIVGHGGVQVDAVMLDRLPALEIVAVFGVGYDGVDVAACRAREVAVTHTPDVLSAEVADTALALTLATLRRLVEADAFVRRGDWERGAFPLTQRLGGRRAGIVGLGRIGREIAARLAACGMRIAYHGRTEQAVPYEWYPVLTELAAASDVLVIACPGGAGTRHLIDREVLDALGREGVLINISRGSVVDEAALIAALQEGRVAAAGLDVYEDEPRVPMALRELAQTVLLPHVGSATVETRGAMADLVVKNLRAHFAGAPLLTPVP